MSATSNPASDPSGPTGKLATWSSGFHLDQAPAAARERAKALILDGIACALVGAQLPWSRIATEIVRATEGSGGQTIVGTGLKTSAPGAALLNGTFIQGFELDDYHPLAPLHSASLVLPALWAALERGARFSGWQFLEAAMVGFEVGPRVGLALHGGQMLSRGWHSGSVFGTHAAAAAVGRLLALDPARMEDAFGLAGTQSAGLMAAQYEAMSKRMHHGFSARNGMYAAMLAQGGYTGIKRVFEREYGGYLSTFGEGHDPDASQVCAELGSRWEIERVVIKQYAAMGGIHSPLDALFDADRQRRLVPDEIESIRVDVTHAVYHHGWWELERPLTPIGAQMNIGYALAVAVIDREAMVKQFSPQRIDADDVWALIPRIKVCHDPEFDAGGPLKRGRVHLVVTFKDGEKIAIDRAMSRSIETPATTQDVVRKYKTLTTGLISDDRQAQIQATVLSLENLDDARDLLNLLGAPVEAPF